MFGTPPPPQRTQTHHKCGEWERSFLVYLSVYFVSTCPVQRFMLSAFILQKGKKKPLHLHFYYKEIRADHLFLGGGGRGGLANLAGTNYLFSAWTWPENLFSGIPRPEYLFSSATKFWKSKKKSKKQKKQKKKNKKTNQGCKGGCFKNGGQDRIFHVIYLFLKVTGMCMQSVCECMLVKFK